MAQEEGAARFRSWANSIGCPPSKLPDKQGLRAFYVENLSFTERIRSLQEVKEVRDQILAHQLLRYEKSGKNSEIMPPILEKYHKLQKIKEELRKVNSSIEKVKADISTVKNKFRAPDYEYERLEDERIIIDLRTRQMEAKHQKALENMEIINAAMPAKGTGKSGSNLEKEIRQFMEKRSLDETFSQDVVREFSQVDPKELWEAIMKIAKGALTELKTQTKRNPTSEQNVSIDSTVTKIKALEMVAFIKLKGVQMKIKKEKAESDKTLNAFADLVEKQINLHSSEESSSDLINEFVFEVAKKMSMESKRTFLLEKLKDLHTQALEKSHAEKIGSLVQQTQDLNDQSVEIIRKIEKNINFITQIEYKEKYSKFIFHDVFRNCAVLDETEEDVGTHKEETQFFLDSYFPPDTGSEYFKQFEDLKVVPFYHLNERGFDLLFERLNVLDEHLKEHLDSPQVVTRPLTVDVDRLVAMDSAFYEESLEKLEKAEAVVSQYPALVLRSKRLLEFLIQNPLRKFVSPIIKFEGRTYKEYENEFNVHLRAIMNK